MFLKNKGSGGFPAIFCNILGTVMILAVIALCLPVTVPKLFGYEVYHVTSGSMEPEIPTGSIIYVKAENPSEIQVGDVIAFWRNGTTVVHRVTANQVMEGYFTTKGDANGQEDIGTVPYGDLIGRVTNHYPALGRILTVYSGGIGKGCLVCFAACGAILNILAGRIRARRL